MGTKTNNGTKQSSKHNGRHDHGEHQPVEIWNLTLYVAGQTPKSLTALANLKRLCEEHLKNRYRIEIVDLLKHPSLAANDQILAIPTLVRKLPSPIRKIIGDLSNTERVLLGMGLDVELEVQK